MSGEAIEKISRAVDDLIHQIGMSGSVRKKWVYDDRCYVVDFKYKGAKFAFDFVPGPAGGTAVDFVPRRRCLALRSHDAAYGGKWRVADTAAPDAALERFSAVLGQICRILNETGSTGSEASASQATGAAGAREGLRVGILTLPLNTNFGGNLQAFALADTLRAMGHRTILINRRHAPRNFVEDDGRVEASLARPLLADSIEVERKNRRIAAFVDRHVGPSTPAFHSSRQLARNIGRYGLDAIIVGSDQVWRPQYTRALLEDFFLDFLKDAPPGIRKISYAASFGTDSWEYGQDSQHMAARLLQGFDAVSVREDSGVELCRSQLGRDALHVLDPTLLVSPERYVELFSEKVTPAPEARLVAYILDPSEDRSALLAAISGRLGLPAHSTNGQPYLSGDPLDGTGGDDSVERWLASIHGAEFFVTDSFHGMIFAILFRRPFLVYANPGRGLARFTSMLRLLGLEDRLVTQAVETDIDQALRPIDWDEVDRHLDRMRRISMEFLKAALDAVPKPRDLARISKVTNPLGVQCTGCGACVSESRGALRMDWTPDGFLEPAAAADAVPPEAIRVCPFNPAPEPQVADEDALGQLFLGDARHHSGDAGRYENAYVGYSKEFRLTSSSGGIATYVFDRLLREGIVDHLFVVRGDAENGYAYALFDGSGDIRSISKTRYFPVTLAQLFEIIDGQEGRIGISGVACFIKAVRLKQHYHPELKDRIPFLTGIICGGLKSRHYTDYLAQSAGIPGTYGNAEYRVKNPDSSASDYFFAATDSGDRVHRVRMKRLGDMWGSGLFKSKACDFCTDVTTELADLSLGDAWLPDYAGDGLGHSVIVTRTPLADALIRDGIAAGELEAKAVPVSTVVQSQRGGLDHKFKGVRFRSRMVADHTLLPVPHVRTRVQRDLSPGDMLVQVLRERVRARSLRTWNAVQDAGRFTRRMQSSRKILADLTRIRSKNADYIRQVTTAALTDPQREPAYRQGFHSLRVMMRWLRRKLHTGEVSLETLRSLVQVP